MAPHTPHHPELCPRDPREATISIPLPRWFYYATRKSPPGSSRNVPSPSSAATGKSLFFLSGIRNAFVRPPSRTRVCTAGLRNRLRNQHRPRIHLPEPRCVIELKLYSVFATRAALPIECQRNAFRFKINHQATS